MRTAVSDWSIGSPRVDAMIAASQAFATRTFTAPKVRLPFVLCGCVRIEATNDVRGWKPSNESAPALSQLCEVLAQTLVDLQKLVNWTARLEPGGFQRQWHPRCN